MSNWTLFSNHGHVLVCLARDSEARLRDVAADVGITERAVQKIVRDLQDGGMVSVTKNGRRNSYRIHKKQNLRHELEAHSTLRDFLSLVRKPEKKRKAKPEVQKTRVTNPKVSKPKVTKPKVTRPRAIGIEAISPPAEPKRKKTVSSKPKTEKTTISDSIEKQQGSLF